MKILTKACLFGLSLFAMTGCNILGGVGGGIKEVFDKEKFISEGLEKETSCKDLVKNATSLTIKYTKVTDVGTDEYTVVGTKDSKGYWQTQETDNTKKIAYGTDTVFWESKTISKLASLIQKNPDAYDDYKFEKNSNGYKMNDENYTYVFNKDGLLTKYETYFNVAGAITSTTKEFIF